MNCRTFHAKISPWLDGELDEGEIQVLERHLSECPECRRFYHLSRTINAGMRSKADIRPPAELVGRIEDVAFGKDPKVRSARFSMWLQVPVAAMLLIAAIGLGGLSGSRLSAILTASGADNSLMLVSTQDDFSIEDMISALDREQ